MTEWECQMKTPLAPGYARRSDLAGVGWRTIHLSRGRTPQYHTHQGPVRGEIRKRKKC